MIGIAVCAGLATRIRFSDDIRDQKKAAAYVAECLGRLQAAGHLGAMAWDAFDYRPELWGREPLASNPHERFFGVFRADRTPKLMVDAWQKRSPSNGRATEPARWIDIDRAAYWSAPQRQLTRLFERYVRVPDGDE